MQELAVHMVGVGTLVELKGVDQSWRSIARSVLCRRLCAVRDCRTQLSEIAELDVEGLDKAGRLWEATVAGRQLPSLAQLHGFGFAVDVAKVRGVDLSRSFGASKTALRGCITSEGEAEGEPPLKLLIAAVACAGSGKMGAIPVEAMRKGGAPRRRSVTLEGKAICDEEAMLVACLVPAMGSLKLLDLSDNKIGAAGALAIAAAVAASGSLAELNIGGNNIGVEGAKAIADAVAASGSLTTLDLQENAIGDAGAKALADAMAASGSLAHLYLNQNNICDEGAKALATTVAASGSLALTKLVVDYWVVENAELMAACKSKGVRLEYPGM